MNIRQGLDVVVRQVGLLVNHEAQQLALYQEDLYEQTLYG